MRLAWHSSGTVRTPSVLSDCAYLRPQYDAMSKTGGSEEGTIRFKEELAHGANAGLDVAVSRYATAHPPLHSLGLVDAYI